jgi:hypothetical protein
MGEVTGLTGHIPEYVHPVDVLQGVCDAEGFSYERDDADCLDMEWVGVWTTYHLSFSWIESLESLHMGCAFELKVPKNRLAEVRELVRLINEQSWVGHFDLWDNDNTVLYRYSLILPGGVELSPAQCNFMVQSGVGAADQYYQAFHYVVWAGKSAKEALEAVQFVTVGEA